MTQAKFYPLVNFNVIANSMISKDGQLETEMEMVTVRQ
jgi:hypothetical protein